MAAMLDTESKKKARLHGTWSWERKNSWKL
jgi:hypothetical protein